MDGFAVKIRDAGKPVRIAGTVMAGDANTYEMHEGECVAVMTGARCPVGTEAVIKQEKVTVIENIIELPADIQPGQFISPKGSECSQGAHALEAGSILSPLAIAILASVGQTRVPVYAPPRLGFITTGDELNEKIKRLFNRKFTC